MGSPIVSAALQRFEELEAIIQQAENIRSEYRETVDILKILWRNRPQDFQGKTVPEVISGFKKQPEGVVTAIKSEGAKDLEELKLPHGGTILRSTAPIPSTHQEKIRKVSKRPKKYLKHERWLFSTKQKLVVLAQKILLGNGLLDPKRLIDEMIRQGAYELAYESDKEYGSIYVRVKNLLRNNPGKFGTAMKNKRCHYYYAKAHGDIHG